MINTITCGDSLELLKDLKNNSVDCIITDPPYFIGFNSSAKEGGRQDWGNHTLLNPLFDNLFTEFNRILKSDGKMFIFTDWRTYPILYLRLSRYLKIRNCIVWDFDWIKAGSHFRFTHEFIVYATMPNAKGPENRSISDVWKFPPINFTAKRNHPAEKPVEIIEHAINLVTDPSDLILDPFAGSGTICVACKKNNRNYIGIEINPDYVKTGLQRLEKTQIQKVLAKKDGLMSFDKDEGQ